MGKKWDIKSYGNGYGLRIKLCIEIGDRFNLTFPERFEIESFF